MAAHAATLRDPSPVRGRASPRGETPRVEKKPVVCRWVQGVDCTQVQTQVDKLQEISAKNIDKVKEMTGNIHTLPANSTALVNLNMEKAKAKLLSTTAPMRQELIKSLREVSKGGLDKDVEMWKPVREFWRQFLDNLWDDVEHELECKIERAVLKKKMDSDVRGPEGGILIRFRAFVLHHFLPYDRSIFGRLKDPIFVCIMVMNLLPIHGLRVSIFSVIFVLISFPDVPDEFQLINFILLFKGTQFFSQGLLLALLGAMQYFFCVTWEKDDILTCVKDRGPGAGNGIGQLFDYLGTVGLVWLAFLSLRRSKPHFKGAYLVDDVPQKRPSHATGRAEKHRPGGRLYGLLLFDVKCLFVSLTALLFLCVVTYGANREFFGAQFRANLFWCRVFYGLCSLPFIVFTWGPFHLLLTHSPRTGFNEHGACVAWTLPMAPPPEQKAPKGWDRIRGELHRRLHPGARNVAWDTMRETAQGLMENHKGLLSPSRRLPRFASLTPQEGQVRLPLPQDLLRNESTEFCPEDLLRPPTPEAAARCQLLRGGIARSAPGLLTCGFDEGHPPGGDAEAGGLEERSSNGTDRSNTSPQGADPFCRLPMSFGSSSSTQRRRSASASSSEPFRGLSSSSPAALPPPRERSLPSMRERTPQPSHDEDDIEAQFQLVPAHVAEGRPSRWGVLGCSGGPAALTGPPFHNTMPMPRWLMKASANMLPKERKLQWMWADAGVVGTTSAHHLAELNPVRWSIPRLPSELVDHLESRHERRPVQVRSVGQKVSRTFPNAQEAAAWVRKEEEEADFRRGDPYRDEREPESFLEREESSWDSGYVTIDGGDSSPARHGGGGDSSPVRSPTRSPTRLCVRRRL